MSSIDLDMLPQPDDTTCGPTCLHAVYRYYGDTISLPQVIEETSSLSTGGTLAVLLGRHALMRGYSATIYSYNLRVFDPTWARLTSQELKQKLILQRAAKTDEKLHIAVDGYIDFLNLGGKVRFVDLTGSLLRGFLRRGVPIITALSSTYLYRSPREIPSTTDYDDIRGVPTGHFVVLTGYDKARRLVSIADPFLPNPFMQTSHYDVELPHLVCSILLGVLTYDAKLLIIEKHKPRNPR